VTKRLEANTTICLAIGRQLLHEEGECSVVDQVNGRTQIPALATLLEGAQIAHGPGHLFAWQLLGGKPRHQRPKE